MIIPKQIDPKSGESDRLCTKLARSLLSCVQENLQC